jgi:hypothetical protein
LQKSLEVKAQSEKEKEKEMSALHKSVSESHKPNMRDKKKGGEKKKGEGENLIMMATKSELRDVRNNPNQVFVIIVYKDTLLLANDLTSVPSAIATFCRNTMMFFRRKHQLGFLLCGALSIKLISFLELHFLTDQHTASILKKPKKYKGKCNHF